MQITHALNEISKTSDQREKLTKYQSILDGTIQRFKQIEQGDTNSLERSSELRSKCLNEMKEFLTHVTHESLSLVVSRQLIRSFLNELNQQVEGSSLFDIEYQKEILIFSLECTLQRSVAFEEQIAFIRETIAGILEHEEEWTEAARMLQGITLDSGHRQIPDEYKLKIYNQIIRLYLEDEDDTSAEAYLNRMGHLMHTCTNQQMIIQYKASQARLLDFKKQFLSASSKYLELSLNMEIHESERLAALRQSMICALLASAGPLRNKLLSTLYKDERIRELNFLFLMLEKMYMERMVPMAQVEEFAKLLRPHQLARLGDGSTVLDRAMMEHNILSASKIYRDITLEGLGELLSVSSIQAEAIVSHMIAENRLQGYIDGIEEIVYFQTQHEIERFDDDITRICYELDKVVDVIIG